MKPARLIPNNESIIMRAYFFPTAIVPTRVYKRAPGGVWYRQSVAGGFKRIKSRNGMLRLQSAIVAALVRPE